jgi:molecular chaperone HscA
MGKIAINIATGSLQKDEAVVGIDLGTTNSLVAIIHPETGKPIALREHDSSSLLPSVIWFDEGGNPVVGDIARSKLLEEPERTIFSAKRLMGKSYRDISEHAGFFSYRVIDDDADSLVRVQVGERFYSPVELSAILLRELRKRAEHILKTPVNKAVITVPAYFNDTQRQATRDAGKLAGLDVLRIINEPTAASLAYGLGLKREETRTIAVYDLGGGTFDVSVLRIADGVFEVLSTNGDTYLGGDDADRILAGNFRNQLPPHATNTDQEPAFNQELRLLAEEAKKKLSFQDEFSGKLRGFEVYVRRIEFENLIAPLIGRTLDCCREALKDAGMSTVEIDEVVMVGGSTRIPAVKAAVSAFFGRPVNDTLNPDEVVALGAAVQADILSGKNKETLLLDVAPLSLGVETMGGLMDVIIPRNSKIPSRAARQYTTHKDGQSGMMIAVYQGERDLVKDNRLLASFNLTGIPAMPAGLAKVEIGFLIDADGILTVRAKELRSGVEQSIEVKSQYGLSDEMLEKMLLDSITHAKDDMALRALVEARTEAAQLLETTEKFIRNNSAQLQNNELLDTAVAMQALQMAIGMEQKDLIREKMEELNAISRPYAERIMDRAIAEALRGKSI